MYDNQTVICQEIVEANWVEYLAYVKKTNDEQEENRKKRMALLQEMELELSPSNIASAYPDKRYYDISLMGFWNWYIENKV